MTRQVEQITGGVIAGADHVIDPVIGYVFATLQTLPVAGWRGMHRNFCVGRFYCAVRLLAGAAQRMRHCRARVSFDLSSVAKLAAARTSRLHHLRRSYLRIRARGIVLAQLPLSE